MIYNNTVDSKSLKEAFLEIGFDEESVNLAVQFMDTEKERDYTLLDRIKLKIFGDVNYNVLRPLFQILKNDIRKKHDKELLNRYALVCFALAGSSAHHLAETYSDYDKIESIFLPAFVSRYGENDAQIYFYALIISARCWGFRFQPEYCVKAAEYLLDRGDEIHALQLCDKAYECRKENTDDEYITKAADIILRCCKNTSDVTGRHLASLAFCVNSSDEAREFFNSRIEHLKFTVLNAAQGYAMYSAVLEAIADIPSLVDARYISGLASQCRGYHSVFSGHLPRLAREHTEIFENVMKEIKDGSVFMLFADAMKEGCPEHQCDFGELQKNLQNDIIENLSEKYPYHDEIKSYLSGESDYETIYPFIENFDIGYVISDYSIYYPAFGLDDFAVRCLCVIYPCIDTWRNAVSAFTGFSLHSTNVREFTEKIIEEAKLPEAVVSILANAGGAGWGSSNKDAVYKNAELISRADVSKMSSDCKIFYISAFEKEPDKYKENVLDLVAETGKAVKESVVKFIAKTNWKEDICALLSSKRAAVRETAVGVIEIQGADNYKDVLTAAFAAEKSEKLKTRIAALIGENVEPAAKKSDEDELKKLTAANKLKKLDWLFASAFSTVKSADGSEADTTLLKALMMCYAAEVGTINPLAGGIAEKLNTADLEKFSCEVFGKWIDEGAAAKTKWVLYFTAVHGGNEMIDNLMHYIREWSENSRGAIAAEAVYALALNGSSNALMKVDGMAHKFKKRQVKDAANAALVNAAEKLGISKEELGDRIVPDMGFDERMCRTFDYGNRQFSVYITPSLEIEIFNGDKKIKNLPKPGANDDAEKAEKAYADFREMKKQMKTVVSTQKDRLEYVLMCDRKWTSEAWNKLFVANPVMHCFAIGLIWGTYEDGKLSATFRYLDDGSFTTSDEDEYEIPENALIGLVHPVELTEEEKTTWAEQLADYEIIQPFPQLARPVFVMTDEEAEDTKIKRFDAMESTSHGLTGKLLKNGWEKGCAEDAGCFYEFYHADITGYKTDSEGKTVPVGYVAELKFSGAYIGVYEIENEEITVEDLIFHDASDTVKAIKCSEVNKRYFSEIIAQITAAIGAGEETEE